MNTQLLRQLVAAAAVSRAVLRAVPGGYVLVAAIGLEEQLLQTQRGGARRFRSLDAAASFAHSIGLSRVEVDLSGFVRSRALF